MAGPHDTDIVQARAMFNTLADKKLEKQTKTLLSNSTAIDAAIANRNKKTNSNNDSVDNHNYRNDRTYTTETSATGANYPTGYYKGNKGPTTKAGMLLAALNPMSAILKSAGKTFWNQTKYGMNDAVKVHYDKMVADGLPTGKSVQDVVNDAREMYHVANDKAGKPTRGADNNDINSTGATHTVDPDSGDVVEDTPETVKAEMGKLGLTNVTGPDGRPTWAPTDPNAEGAAAPTVDPYAPTWNQPSAGGMFGDGSGIDYSTQGTGATNSYGDPSYAPSPFAARQAPQPDRRAQGRPDQGPQYSQAPQSQASAYELAARQGMLLPQAPQPYAPQAPQAPQAPYQAQAPRGTPEYETLQRMVAGTSAPVAEAMQLNTQAPTGAPIPTGSSEAGTFKPVTFRSGTGTSTTDAAGTTTALNAPYSGLSSLVGQGQGLLGQAAGNAQQDPNQLNFDMNTDQRAQDLFAQRSALLEPVFAQQRALAQQDMFGSGRLGLRLAGQGVGAGSGMVQPDAFGMNQAQSQALSGLASQSTDDAFAQAQAMAGLESQRFGQNQQAQQQQYANLVGSGEGMLSAGLQGAQLEAGIAQQQSANQQAAQAQSMSQARLALDTQAQAQNYGLASQGQSQDYGLNAAQFNLASQGQQQNFGLAQQTQDQSYGLNQQNFALNERGQMQDYGLAQDRFGLAQQTQDQSYAMANRNFGLASRSQDLAELSNSQNFGLANRGQNLAELSNNQNYGLAGRGQSLAELSSGRNFGLASQGQNQNYGLAQQQQMQDYGLSQQKMGLASQQQLQDYEMGMLTGNRNYNLARDTAAQNYELATEQNRIGLITGQAKANNLNYQPNDWLNVLGGGLSAYAGTSGGASAISAGLDYLNPFT